MSNSRVFIDIDESEKIHSINITSDLDEPDTVILLIDLGIDAMKKRWYLNKKDVKELLYARINKAFPPNKHIE